MLKLIAIGLIFNTGQVSLIRGPNLISDRCHTPRDLLGRSYYAVEGLQALDCLL